MANFKTVSKNQNKLILFFFKQSHQPPALVAPPSGPPHPSHSPHGQAPPAQGPPPHATPMMQVPPQPYPQQYPPQGKMH